jgi:hypothetical protein
MRTNTRAVPINQGSQRRPALRLLSILGGLLVAGAAGTTAHASFINRVTNLDTPIHLKWEADWIAPRGAGFHFQSPNWSFGFEDAAPHFEIIDLVQDDGEGHTEGGAHLVGPHGEVVPNTFPGEIFANYDPGARERQYLKLEGHGATHIDLFTFVLSPVAGGVIPPGGNVAVPATHVKVEFVHIVPTPGVASLLGLAALTIVRRRGT